MRKPNIMPYYKSNGAEIVIRLLYDELKYSVDYATWKTAQLRDDDKQKFEIQTDEENADWMTRCIDEAVNSINRKLRAYTAHRSRMRTNECEKRDSWEIHLLMEEGWQGDAEALAVLMHRYVVDSVLAKWYSMVMPEMTESYLIEMNDTLDDIVNEARACDIEGVMFQL